MGVAAVAAPMSSAVNVGNSSGGSRNLNSIVEAIKHLEGENLFPVATKAHHQQNQVQVNLHLFFKKVQLII